MATIKTQLIGDEQRIITKGGLISCSCCEAECCLYPAALLGSLYSVEDLPDELDMFMSDGTGNVFVGPTTVSRNADGTYGQYNSGTGPHIARSFAGDEWVATYNQIDPSFLCLVDALEADNPPDGSITGVWVFDRFADTYKIAGQSGSATIPESTLIRTGLCRWDGVIEYVEDDVTTTIEVILTYCGNESDICGFIEDPIAGNTFAPRQYKWIMTFSTAPQSFKNAPQKSPEGRYPLSTDPNDYLDVYV